MNFTQQDIDRAVAAERERCASILDAEAARGKEMQNRDGKTVVPFYDPQIIKACIETIEYCAKRIRGAD